jgi:hypothetical protein
MPGVVSPADQARPGAHLLMGLRRRASLAISDLWRCGADNSRGPVCRRVGRSSVEWHLNGAAARRAGRAAARAAGQSGDVEREPRAPGAGGGDRRDHRDARSLVSRDGGVLLAVGPAGIGKTTLLARATTIRATTMHERRPPTSQFPMGLLAPTTRARAGASVVPAPGCLAVAEGDPVERRVRAEDNLSWPGLDGGSESRILSSGEETHQWQQACPSRPDRRAVSARGGPLTRRRSSRGCAARTSSCAGQHDPQRGQRVFTQELDRDRPS